MNLNSRLTFKLETDDEHAGSQGVTQHKTSESNVSRLYTVSRRLVTNEKLQGTAEEVIRSTNELEFMIVGVLGDHRPIQIEDPSAWWDRGLQCKCPEKL